MSARRLIVEITESELTCEYRAPVTTLQPESPTETLARFAGVDG